MFLLSGKTGILTSVRMRQDKLTLLSTTHFLCQLSSPSGKDTESLFAVLYLATHRYDENLLHYYDHPAGEPILSELFLFGSNVKLTEERSPFRSEQNSSKYFSYKLSNVNYNDFFS